MTGRHEVVPMLKREARNLRTAARDRDTADLGVLRLEEDVPPEQYEAWAARQRAAIKQSQALLALSRKVRGQQGF
jgi:hypothetical protein